MSKNSRRDCAEDTHDCLLVILLKNAPRLKASGWGRVYERGKSASVGSRPCGVYLSMASGSSRDSLASSSSRDNPVCFVRLLKTSGPIACSSCGGVTGLLGPVPTHESAVSP